MKKVFLILAFVAALCVTGCSDPHVITLKNGETVSTKSEPKYDEITQFYQYKDCDGEEVTINKDEIRTIKSTKK